MSKRRSNRAPQFTRKHKITKISQRDLDLMETCIVENGNAMHDGPRKKRWSTHDLKNVKPLTSAQEDLFHAYFNNKQICAYGSAGTGKTFLALYLALNEVLDPRYDQNRIILLRSAVPTKDIGLTDIYPQGEKEIFTITFHDGSTTRCCSEHLWEVWYPEQIGQKASRKIKSTKEISELIDLGINVSIPLFEPVNLKTPESLPIDPYILGVLLGDGCITNNVMFSTKDSQVLELVEQSLIEGYTISDNTSTPFDYRIIGSINMHNTTNGITNYYKQALLDLELLGTKSNTKFIPDEYKNASLSQRIALIQGLMDTDGTVSNHKKGGRGLSFTTVSEQLAKDVQQIFWSIGATCSISTRTPTYRYKNKEMKGQLAYTLNIAHPKPKTLFRLDRKRDRCLEHFNNGRTKLRRRFASIEPTSREQAQCIKIFDEKQLYVTDDYIVTHNTFLALYLALNEVLDPRYQQNRIILLRSAVPTKDIGFMPGTLEEKLSYYENPYRDICAELVGRSTTYDDMKQAGLIDFQSTSYVRGLTWNDAVIIVDEGQNCNFHEINSIMTRLGDNAKIIFTGDHVQTDLVRTTDKDGMIKFLKIAGTMNEFDCVQFTKHDIVRSSFVKSWIEACEDAEAA